MDGKDEDQDTGHSTQKTVGCMARAIIENSGSGDRVYEPFSGSDTTIIAAEIERQGCFAIELSAEYVDMAVLRWQAFTGREALLESDGSTYSAAANTLATARNDTLRRETL